MNLRRVGPSRLTRASFMTSCALAVSLSAAGAARAGELGLDGPAVAPLETPVFTRDDLRAEPAPLFVIAPQALDQAVFTARDLAPAPGASAADAASDMTADKAADMTAAIAPAQDAQGDAAAAQASEAPAPAREPSNAATRDAGAADAPAIAAKDTPSGPATKSAAIAPSDAQPDRLAPAAKAEAPAASADSPAAVSPASASPTPVSPAPVASPPVSSPAPAVGLADLTPAAVRAGLEARLSERARGRATQLQRKAREDIGEAYAAGGDAPFWIVDGRWTQAARGAFERLRRADEDGLDLGAAALATLGEPGVESELALSEAVVAYARQAAGGRVEPWRIASTITAKPPTVGASEALDRVASASGSTAAAQALAGFNPPHAGYAALRQKLAETRAAATRPTHAPIPVGPTLKVGMRDPRVALARARLGLEPEDDGDARGPLYDARLAEAVKAFQRENGMRASGWLTPPTAVALSGGEASQVEGDIIANMERWRWLPRDLGATYVAVNIPEFRLALKEGERTVFTTRVVVGKPESPTPVFSDAMRYLVVNPTWTMPPSILEKEALPNLANDPDYYAKRGYEVIQKNGKLIVRQPPGERNALGHIKFMFPNDHAVYLHDTPSRGLFERDRRAFSHGCVRVDQPFDLAEAVLAGKWSAAGLRKMIGPKERSIPLQEPLPIHLTYFTARVDESGRLVVADDLYGYSRRLRAAMGLDGEAALAALGPTQADAAAAADRAKRRAAAAARKARAKQDSAARADAERTRVSQTQPESRGPRSFFDWLSSGGGQARDPALSAR